MSELYRCSSCKHSVRLGVAPSVPPTHHCSGKHHEMVLVGEKKKAPAE